ncbi:hypothetical protein TD95_003882 [Thielaviopsis punctulata]|uniref:Myb-like domain-containing protein n=1 Tax=Thielaviopsis punctulata TaxID=72032 RepID=A0A0F4ZI48_9PEZI|nr:hypothetical protein TD95_003882 [Thielaviopsis punctulata]
MAPMPMPHHSAYNQASDTMDRHEYGVNKNRKMASTGGGRAWSEEEEVYLLQTRMQKMPYKHIAAHLKKTELACRLHYHQLSHGPNRRKRTTSVSSGSSSHSHSPIMTASAAVATGSPLCEPPLTRSITPPGSIVGAGPVYTPASPARSMHLPAIHSATPPYVRCSSAAGHVGSPRLPSILPKPLAMTLPPPIASSIAYHSAAEPHSAPLNASFPRIPSPNPLHMRATTPAPAPTLPLPSPLPAHMHAPHVDMHRLSAAYSTHKAQFWAAVSAEYGGGASASALESAWERKSACCSPAPSGSAAGAIAPPPPPSRFSLQAPLSPAASPEHHREHRERDEFRPAHDKTRISAILGVDANPRSSHDRDFVRRLEASA